MRFMAAATGRVGRRRKKRCVRPCGRVGHAVGGVGIEAIVSLLRERI